ncbi:MHJ_0274 family protein [Mesomycoplasma hyorhinis]|uniref:MHJ_0274 family protein n=1 Tax=Mesomycoplasma hyorhinis TaxID=2100 RepID=UPI001C04EAAD|nr:hypothetical protein [Mesomycoplasma hyorhinis]
MPESSVTLYVVLALLLVFIVVFILFNYFSDRKKKRRIIKEKQRIKDEETKFILKTSARVNFIIEKNEKLLSEFKVSVGDFKMSQINNFAKNALDYLYIQEQFQDIFIRNPFEKDETFLTNFQQLMNLKSNLWTKNHKELINYFVLLSDQYLNNDNTKEEYIKQNEVFAQTYLDFIEQVKYKQEEVDNLFNVFKQKDELERLEYLRAQEQLKPKTFIHKAKDSFCKLKKVFKSKNKNQTQGQQN